MIRWVGSIAGAALLVAFAIACGGSTTSPTTVTSLAVTGSTPVVGATSQFTATATMSNGTTQDVTSLSVWQSSDVSIATVSSTGTVTGVAAGSASVTATYQSATASDPITVTAP